MKWSSGRARDGRLSKFFHNAVARCYSGAGTPLLRNVRVQTPLIISSFFSARDWDATRQLRDRPSAVSSGRRRGKDEPSHTDSPARHTMNPGAERAPLLRHEASKPEKDTLAALKRQVRGGIGVQGVALALCALALAAGVAAPAASKKPSAPESEKFHGFRPPIRAPRRPRGHHQGNTTPTNTPTAGSYSRWPPPTWTATTA